MKKIDLVQLVGIIANIGVIMGIAFLAVELRQTTNCREPHEALLETTKQLPA